MAAPANGGGDGNFFSATSNVPFQSESELHAHYRSDFHRYNLKRRVAGLGPVTKEWFELHRDKLLSRKAGSGSGGGAQAIAVFVDPLSKKTFGSQKKYVEFTQSNKYKKLLKAAGYGPNDAPPEPVVKHKAPPSAAAAPVPASPHTGAARADPAAVDYDSDGGDSASSWETLDGDGDGNDGPLSGMDVDGGASSSAWNPRACLFDGHVSATIEDNIEYMYKRFGFSLPDVEWLTDPEGLLRYLGAKLSEGFIPLYASGLDVNAKTFGSLHAVQRHMVDTGKTRLLYEGNEDEYADYYDYTQGGEGGQGGEGEGEGGEGGALALRTDGGAEPITTNGYELFVPANKTMGGVGGGGGGGGGGRVIGSRDLARYYRQRPRPLEHRRSVLVNRIAHRYRMLGLIIRKKEESMVLVSRMNDRENQQRRHFDALQTHYGINNALIKKLPRGEQGEFGR